jgi:hypothetical protein
MPTRCFYVKTAQTRVVLSLQLGPTRSCTRVRRFCANGDGIVTSPCVFQYCIWCIRKYNDVTEIYGQILWLPVHFTLSKLASGCTSCQGYTLTIFAMPGSTAHQPSQMRLRFVATMMMVTVYIVITLTSLFRPPGKLLLSTMWYEVL